MNGKYAPQIIIKPRITEKSMLLIEKFNQYTFEVARNATKPEIKNAVRKMFNVEVEGIKMLKRKGKRKSLRYWQRGKTGDKKFAIVTLKPGQKIDIFG
ncbi:50S ribosomal protein L23 [Candidatus Calescamantes bacterium]|nr:50S ribosomal protein L23 [Candidatus Calescamantes bacterium]